MIWSWDVNSNKSLTSLAGHATKFIARTGRHQRAWPCSLSYDEASFSHLLQGIGPSAHDGSNAVHAACSV